MIQALSDRMNAKDFQDYTSNLPSKASVFPLSKKSIPYVLEKRDGSLIQQHLQLDDSVENVLKSLSRALEMSGAASLPPPPTPPSQADQVSAAGDTRHFAQASNNGEEIDHQFDVNTMKGRDLYSFLKSISGKQINERRASRMDAAAAALVARRLYSFQAIDGISMGWSSASFAILLRSLIQLHEEHSTRFHVNSFYPLRLVFSPDDYRSSFDVYSGNLYLRPASTQLQWLEALQEVTQGRLDEFQENRLLLQEHTSFLQNTLNVKMAKGHSCSSMEYHVFLKRMADMASCEGSVESTALEKERLRVVVESPAACRRGRITREGTIRVHSNMSQRELQDAILRLSEAARDRLLLEREEEERCKEAISQVQWALGLQKVYRTGVVRHEEFVDALARMIEETERLRRGLSGCSLGISGSGHFCHLADDGSLIIPHDWR